MILDFASTHSINLSAVISRRNFSSSIRLCCCFCLFFLTLQVISLPLAFAGHFVGLQHFTVVAAEHDDGAGLEAVGQFGQAIQHAAKLFVELLTGW